MSVRIKRWKGTKHRVFLQLTNYPELRDDLEQTIATIWYNDLKNEFGAAELKTFTALQFLAHLKNGNVTPAETIRRSWQILQFKNPELRGKKYNERHKKSVEVRKEIVNE